MLREETMQWMQSVFTGQDEANRARLLRVIHEFLVSEAGRKSAGGEELLGQR
jgi:hypothetical protein